MIDMKKHRSVGRIVSCIHRFTHIHLNNELEPYNIGIGQLHFLMKLYKKDGINQEMLAHCLQTDKATSARAIEKLEKEGFVKRKIDQTDKRAYKIYLTKKAKDLKIKIRGITKKWTNSLLTGFSEDEKEILFSFLDRIDKNASDFK
jgi:DNA-binding MarR family transcriptional regulator